MKTITEDHVRLIKMIATGLVAKEIAMMLGLRLATVEGRKQRLCEMAGVKNTAALISWAYQQRILTPPGVEVWELDANRFLRLVKTVNE